MRKKLPFFQSKRKNQWLKQRTWELGFTIQVIEKSYCIWVLRPHQFQTLSCGCSGNHFSGIQAQLFEIPRESLGIWNWIFLPNLELWGFQPLNKANDGQVHFNNDSLLCRFYRVFPSVLIPTLFALSEIQVSRRI